MYFYARTGVGLTTIALLGASQQFRTGNREALNRFLRFRVVAQGVTIAACVIGSLVYTKDKTIEKAVKRQEELEKIRVAGTRPVAAPEPAPAPALTGETSTTPAPPSGTLPAAGEELWKKWGVGTGGKS